MAFEVSGSTATQSGTDDVASGAETLLASIGLSGLTSENGVYTLATGNNIAVSGTFKDESGRFKLNIIDLARLYTNSTGEITIKNGVINLLPDTLGTGTVPDQISFKSTFGAQTETTGGVYFDNTLITGRWRLKGSTGGDRGRMYLPITQLVGCVVRMDDMLSTDTRDISRDNFRIRLQTGGKIVDTTLYNVSGVQLFTTGSVLPEIKGVSATNQFRGFTTYNLGSNIMVKIRDYNFVGTDTNWGLVAVRGGLDWINPSKDGVLYTEAQIKAKQFAIPTGTVNDNNVNHTFTKSQSEKLVLADGSIADGVRVLFKTSLGNLEPTIDVDGLYTQDVRIFRTNARNSSYTGAAISAFKSYIPSSGIEKAVLGYHYQLQHSVYDTYDSFQVIKGSSLLILNDDLVTERTKATVDAYVSLDTPAKLYDRAKAYLVDNYSWQTATLLSRTGNVIDAGAFNVTIDATASSVFSVSSDTITIKATTFTGDITTTGTVTLSNGASVVGGIVDANGDSYLSFSDVTEWKAYASSADRSADTGLLGSGSSSDIFRFTFSENTVYYLALTVSSDVILKNVTPSASGQTTINLSQVGLLTSILGTLEGGVGASASEIRAVVDDAFVAYDPPTHTELQAVVDGLTDATPADIYTYFTASSRSDAFKANVSAIPTNPVLTTDSRLGRLDVAVSSRLATASYDPATPADIYTYFTASSRSDALKADVSAIPTNPVLTTDSRLDRLDVAVSTRLASSGYTSITAADIYTYFTGDDRSDAFKANVSAIPTNPVLTTDSRLGRLDVAVSSRLATSSYLPLTASAIWGFDISGVTGDTAAGTVLRSSSFTASGLHAALDSYPSLDELKSFDFSNVAVTNNSDGSYVVVMTNPTSGAVQRRLTISADNLTREAIL